MRAEIPVHEMAAADSRQVREQGFFRAGRPRRTRILRGEPEECSGVDDSARNVRQMVHQQIRAVGSGRGLGTDDGLGHAQSGGVGLEDYPTTD